MENVTVLEVLVISSVGAFIGGILGFRLGSHLAYKRQEEKSVATKPEES